MRHGDKQNNLSRTASHRKALMANLGCQLITYKRITTTLAKAKALRTYIEPLITKTKANETQAMIMHNHRIVFSYLGDKSAVKELFTVVGPKVAARPGGYTRIIKLGQRVGDNAELAMIELVDFNEIYGKGIGESAEPAKKTRRGRAKKTATTESAEAGTAVVAEEAASSKDNLKLIEGIGPKVEEALNAAGINTFAQLASTSADDVKKILTEAEGNFSGQDPTTWGEQAQLAADGKMDELKELQDKLQGGRSVE